MQIHQKPLGKTQVKVTGDDDLVYLHIPIETLMSVLIWIHWGNFLLISWRGVLLFSYRLNAWRRSSQCTWPRMEEFPWQACPLGMWATWHMPSMLLPSRAATARCATKWEQKCERGASYATNSPILPLQKELDNYASSWDQLGTVRCCKRSSSALSFSHNISLNWLPVKTVIDMFALTLEGSLLIYYVRLLAEH